MSTKRELAPWKATVAVLRDDEVGLAGAGALLLVGAFAVQQDHHVGVLLERPGFTQIGERRLLVDPLLGTTVELRQRDDRHLQLLREQLERTRELRDLLLTRLDALARGHELQVVDDDELQAHLLLEAAALRAD